MRLENIAQLPKRYQEQALEQFGRKCAKESMDKPGKYHNRKCAITLPENGKSITFDSEKEARRFGELRMRLQFGDIRDLKLQVNFTLQEGFTTAEGKRVRPIVYRADFTYQERTPSGWRTVVEDVKGVRTKEYSMKRKMMLEKFGVDIREV